MEWLNKLKYNFKEGNFAVKLSYINIAIYLISQLIRLITKSAWVENHFGLFSFQDIPYQPWTVFTYMFLHANILHLLLNMFMLNIVAKVFFSYFNEKSFQIFYFVGGIIGGLFFLLYQLYAKTYMPLIGASAAIYSVFFAMVSYQPEMRVRLMFVNTPVKLLHLALGLLLLGFLISPQNIGGNISHLGGAVFGYFYMKQFERGNDFMGSLTDTIKDWFKRKKSPLKATKNQRTKPPRDDYEYNEWKAENEKKVDAVLDKISRSGYNSLTKEEKEFLFQQGKK